MLDNIFTVVTLIVLPGVLILGLIKPHILLSWSSKQTRLHVFILCLSLFFFLMGVFFILKKEDWTFLIFTLPTILLIILWRKKYNSSSQFITNKKQNYTVSSFTCIDNYTISPEDISCNCPDWMEIRRNFTRKDPRRVCKHLAFWYAVHANSLPKTLAPYKAIIYTYGYEQQGMPKRGEYEHGELDGDSFAFCITQKKWPWIEVSVNDLMYNFNVDEQIWENNQKPFCAKGIHKRILQRCGLPLDEYFYSLNESGNTITQQHTPNIDDDVIPLLTNALGEIPEGLQCAQRKEYFSVYGTRPRNWFCRVSYNSYKLTSIELFNGQIINISSGQIYNNAKEKFVRLAQTFDWTGKKKQ